MSKKIPYQSHYTIGKFEHHNEIKDTLLQMIDNSWSEPDVKKTDYYSDNITKLDWSISEDFNREWVRFFLPYFQKYMAEEIEQKNMKDSKINCMWFQQYEKGGYHGWHVHDSTYSGVYYVELPEGTPTTQMLTEDGEMIIPDVKEGDILIFPSFVSHRAPVNNDTSRKTIISWNMDLQKPTGILKP